MSKKIGFSLHWTAGLWLPNWLELKDYHGGVVIIQGKAQYQKWNDYTAILPHTWSSSDAPRNRDLIGLTICGMCDAKTNNFGKYPLTPEQIEELCLATAEIAFIKMIDSAEAKTHGEWALQDGYGVHSGDPETRWDLGILKPGKIAPDIVRKTGNQLRLKIHKYKLEIIEKKREVRKLHFENMSLGQPVI